MIPRGTAIPLLLLAGTAGTVASLCFFLGHFAPAFASALCFAVVLAATKETP